MIVSPDMVEPLLPGQCPVCKKMRARNGWRVTDKNCKGHPRR